MTRRKSRGELAVDLLAAYRWWVGGAVTAVVVVLLVVGVNLPTVEITRPYKVAGVAMLAAAVLGYAPASKALDWLYDPPRRYIVSLGFSGDTPGIWELTPAAWDDVEVTDGELYEWPGTKWPIYEAETFTGDTMTAVGTWRGSEPDRVLLRKEKKVEELRKEIEAEADTAIDTEITISSRVRKAIKAIGQAIIDEHAQATTYEGERVADVLTEIRQEVEEDTGSERPDNGEKPIAEAEAEAVEHLAEVATGGEHGREE